MLLSLLLTLTVTILGPPRDTRASPAPAALRTLRAQGSLVRAVRRLEEVLRQLAGALKSVGDMEQAQRFEEAIAKIKRDIIFAASLYL